ncbi:MAG: SLBB domain-containing protein [Deltaproteobacteria bacterium]|nr:MAG: SLBB domain-containing protein [Deltaproteobacteria bacterium]
MTKINKIIAIAIIISNFSCTLFAQQAVSASSTTEGADVSRLTSSSFGSKSGSAGGGLADVTKGSPLLQEQTFGGLTYQVHILGEVNKPGTYRVPASPRLSEAIQIAGDILERGSNRRIEIKRENSKNQKVDLNAFKQFGDLNSNPYLLDNDTIFVPLQGKVVQMVGSVVRPGVYELLNEKNIQDLLSLVGGFASGLDRNVPLKIIRYVNGDKIIINVVNDDEHRKDFILENADVIVAPHFFPKK